PGESPRTNLVPGDALQLEEPLTVDELAAVDEPEGTLLEHLHMRGCGAHRRVRLAVLRDPGPHLVIGLDPRHALAVDEDRVVHQPPAAAYAAVPLEANAACAA